MVGSIPVIQGDVIAGPRPAPCAPRGDDRTELALDSPADVARLLELVSQAIRDRRRVLMVLR